MSEFKHVVFQGRTESFPYTPWGGGNSISRQVNRIEHGEKIKESFRVAIEKFSKGDDNFEFVFLEVQSAINYQLQIDKFEDSRGNISLANCKEVDVNLKGEIENVEEGKIFKASVCLNRIAIEAFYKKVDKYLFENTRHGRPHFEGLIANIEIIKEATLQSFWQEPLIPFPKDNQDVWWEIWLNREILDEEPSEKFYFLLKHENVQIGSRILKFPEHFVILVKGTGDQLRNSLLYVKELAEIRKPTEAADFFTGLDRKWEGSFINDLSSRIIHNEDTNVSVCLLDTGINRIHPLLEKIIPEKNLDAIEPAWTKADTHTHGHGTPMAGLILFGDLTDVFSSSGKIQIVHQLESIKIIERTQPNIPELYGNITIEAVSRGEILYPENKRIVCLAITAPETFHLGKPSSWSAAIDQLIFGNIDERNAKTLFLISSGNLPLNLRLESPLSNHDFSIEDPAQSFNAITVGSYALKVALDLQKFPGAELLASRGGMSPCNSTSYSWENEWPRKPDVVLEGGNEGIFEGRICDHDSLKLLSTGKGGLGKSMLTTFGDTSASTALASKFIAELYYEYPSLLPETIRGLMIHSADWTPSMLNHRSIKELSSEEQKKLVATVGYGVPNISRSKYSAKNSLTLIAEREIRPYRYEGRVKTNEFHLFDLPWPRDVLSQLADEQITLTVTLSYFIEPNPGNKRYSHSSTYQSYGLRFKMIDRNETEERFKGRVSRAIREGQEDYVPEGNDDWILGKNIRDKGSIHKDIWKGNAADLALRNKIAIYPVGGWWKERKRLKRFNSDARYSLLISIDTPIQNVDILTPVMELLKIKVEI